MNAQLTFTLEATPRREDLVHIRNILLEYDRGTLTTDGHHPVIILVREDGRRLVAGILGTAHHGWLHLDMIWVEDAFRRQGIGQKLMEMAEAEGRRHGCHHCMLSTMSEAARVLCRRIGYEEFAELENHPVGRSKFYMRRALA